MDPLAKTGPISGAVGAGGIGRRLTAVCGFGSLLSVRGEAGFSSEAPRHTWASHDGTRSKEGMEWGALSWNARWNKRPILSSNCWDPGGGGEGQDHWGTCSHRVHSQNLLMARFWGWRETKDGSQDGEETATCCYLSQAGRYVTIYKKVSRRWKTTTADVEVRWWVTAVLRAKTRITRPQKKKKKKSRKFWVLI